MELTYSWRACPAKVKYQDVLLRQDAVARVESAIAQSLHDASASASCNSTSVNGSALLTASSWAARLSPAEVSELNILANRAFDKGDLQVISNRFVPCFVDA
jgi:hypothetical protein